MDESNSLIVPFGKYKNKSVLELLADSKYVEWLKQQSWFSTQTQIYNIVVHQTISTTISKTPEHNKLQNLFLCKHNQEKLVLHLAKHNLLATNRNKLQKVLKDNDIIRWFGEHPVPDFVPIIYDTKVKFEDEFNWDIVLYYRDYQKFQITSIAEIEINDRRAYKEKWLQVEKEKHDKNIQLINTFIEHKIRGDICYCSCSDARCYLHNYTCSNTCKVCMSHRKCNQATGLRLDYSSVGALTEQTAIYEAECELLSNKKSVEVDNNYKLVRKKQYMDTIYHYRFYEFDTVIEEKDENQWTITFDVAEGSERKIYCELKPILGDDYPGVLRKMITQIKLTNCPAIYLLIIGKFASISCTKEQLTSIFSQHKIRIVFVDELQFEMPVTAPSTTLATPILNVPEQIRVQDDNSLLLHTQNQLAQAMEKIKQLEEELNILKYSTNPKINSPDARDMSVDKDKVIPTCVQTEKGKEKGKSLKDYFKK